MLYEKNFHKKKKKMYKHIYNEQQEQITTTISRMQQSNKNKTNINENKYKTILRMCVEYSTDVSTKINKNLEDAITVQDRTYIAIWLRELLKYWSLNNNDRGRG